jgi:glycosyltransferase involved in cell wall biosynthesis
MAGQSLQEKDALKVAIVTDAWEPQVNGVVTTMKRIRDGLQERGYQVLMITPDQFRSVPCPGYKEIRLSVRPYRKVCRLIQQAKPDMIHIATEGPLGMAARRYCIKRGLPFASSMHTRFDDYIQMRWMIRKEWVLRYMRWFHNPAACTLVRTRTQLLEMARKGFSNLKVWPGAVDTDVFRPYSKDALALPRPISMYMGRVALEKSIDEFLDLDIPGSKVVIGGGPQLEKLKGQYPDAHFLGPRFGEELARLLSAADVFVFPSRTDTFGLVMLEAMACGVPVAAYPVPGPIDVVTGGTGALEEDLKTAVFKALGKESAACIELAGEYSWKRSIERFISAQLPFEWIGEVPLRKGYFCEAEELLT